MKAMIFAAGLGSRLKPLTDTMPKALVPIAGHPMLEHVILKLKAAGFTEIVINIHHFGEQILDFLEANENFGKEDFASALALSQSLLYKKIKALTNLSVVEFIRSIRLNYAMEKLRSGEYNVTEVSEMCGFSTPAYFSKVFKEYFGKTPTEVM